MHEYEKIVVQHGLKFDSFLFLNSYNKNRIDMKVTIKTYFSCQY